MPAKAAILSVRGKLRGKVYLLIAAKSLKPLQFQAFPMAEWEGFEPSDGF